MTFYWKYKGEESAVISIRSDSEENVEKILDKIVVDKSKWKFILDSKL